MGRRNRGCGTGTGTRQGSLEIVSEESFQKRREGISDTSSCSDCMKERQKESHSERKRRRKPHAAGRSNTPIVVHLRDTIKVSGKGKQSPKCSDSESCGDSDDSLDVYSRGWNNKENVRKLSPVQQLWNNHAQKYGHPLPGGRLPHSGKAFKLWRQNEKNFNAFLSAIEKVHLKGHKNVLLDKSNLNLLSGVHSHTEELLKSVLNNSLNYHGAGEKLDNRRAVDLICNDLHNNKEGSLPSSRPDTPASVSSDDSSDSISSSGSSVISDSSTQESLSGCEDNVGQGADTDFIAADKISQEEIEKLAEFTSGCPLTKYDCPPHECPECLEAYFAYYYAQENDYLNVSDLFSDDKESVSSLPESSDSDQPESARSTRSNSLDSGDSDSQDSPPPVRRVEVSVVPALYKDYRKNKAKHGRGSHHRRHHPRSRGGQPPPPPRGYPQIASYHFYPDTVSIDLSNSDVEFSVYYHSDGSSDHQNQHSNNQNNPPPVPHNQADFYYSGNFCTMMPPSHHPYGYPPAPWAPSMPYYMAGPPGMWMGAPPVAIPRPLCVPRDTKCLNSQRLCLIPAHEIKDFTASQPSQRPWVPLAHPDGSRPVAIYTVMCYNVLCDKYATRQLYGYCPSWALNWEYRKKAIMEEIRQYSADILSLQEVETDQYHNFFLPELKRDGYDGIFSPKSRARTMSESERKHVDGCAIFYKTSKFSLIKEHLLEFNKLAMTTADGSHDMINRVMTKDNIALAALLETKETIWENGVPPEGQQRQPVLVATCHIHWDPEYCDVKLIQTMMLMAELKNIIEESQTNLRPGASKPEANSIPLLLCGDLNSLPDSGVVEYLQNGRVSANHGDFKDLGYEDCLKKLSNSESKDFFTSAFRLAGAYPKDVMPYTNYTFEFKGIIDYIFMSKDFMRPLGVLGPMDTEWFREYKVLGCPHPHIPSDHLPLLVEVEMGAGPIPSSSITSSSSSTQGLPGSMRNQTSHHSQHHRR